MSAKYLKSYEVERLLKIVQGYAPPALCELFDEVWVGEFVKYISAERHMDRREAEEIVERWL